MIMICAAACLSCLKNSAWPCAESKNSWPCHTVDCCLSKYCFHISQESWDVHTLSTMIRRAIEQNKLWDHLGFIPTQEKGFFLFSQKFPKLDNSKLGSTQQQNICWHWHVARIISSQKIYGLYGLKHHIVEVRGDVTMRDGRRTTTTTNKWR